MTLLSEKTIELSKFKSILLFLGSLAFVAAGIVMVVAAQSISDASNGADDLVYAQAMGIAAILFFGLTGIVGAKMLFNNKPGLVLNGEGITDNSSGLSAGFVPWSDITGLEEVRIKGQRFAAVLVADPMVYIERGNMLAQAAKNTNLKICGTPVNISANSLKIRHDELMKTLRDYYNAYGNKNA